MYNCHLFPIKITKTSIYLMCLTIVTTRSQVINIHLILFTKSLDWIVTIRKGFGLRSRMSEIMAPKLIYYTITQIT